MNVKEKIEHPKFWLFEGLIWGLFMFVIMTFIFPWLDGKTVSLRSTIIGIVFYWILGGLFYGYTMKLFRKKLLKRKRKIR